jgi:hypothetical protein
VRQAGFSCILGFRLGRFVIPLMARLAVGESHQQGARRSSGRPVPPAAGTPSAGAGAAEIDWKFMARRFGSACRSGLGQPPVPPQQSQSLNRLVQRHIERLGLRVQPSTVRSEQPWLGAQVGISCPRRPDQNDTLVIACKVLKPMVMYTLTH